MATEEIRLPDIGDFHDVDVVEVLVTPGQRIAKEASLIVLETDKATMEVPSPAAGVLRELKVAVGSKVNEGDLIALVDVDGAAAVQPPAPALRPAEVPRSGELAHRPAGPAMPSALATASAPPVAAAASAAMPAAEGRPRAAVAHASPSVRKLARELGVDLARVSPSGPRGRVLRDDVHGFVKRAVAAGPAGPAGPAAFGGAPARAPEIDFAKYGAIELEPLNRIRRVAAANLHRSWLTIPHVTQHDQADVTELETFRHAQREVAEKRGVKLTFLPFLMRACATVLREMPRFNASLDRTGESLVLKRYLHLGVAVDTPLGLVVPVVRDVDRKSILELAAEVAELSTKARERRLRAEQLEGASFSISSLGGIGGTAFTPIINHPEVAILGVSRMTWQPVYRGDALERRLLLPLSLSYDHRVIDGADAARFTHRLAEVLADLRLVLL